MNPIGSIKKFGSNVVGGAQLVNPSSLYQGVKRLGSDIWDEAKQDVGSVKNKIASKMTRPTPKPKVAPTVATTEYNPGMKGYMKRLNESNQI